MTDLERAQIGVTATLLAQGGLVHGASLVVSALALVLIVFESSMPLAFGSLFVVLLLLELYLAVRVRFDAGLFADIATGRIDAAQFDAAMRALGLLPETKVGRDWTTRARGARRLLHTQALIVMVQCTAFVFLLWGLA